MQFVLDYQVRRAQRRMRLYRNGLPTVGGRVLCGRVRQIQGAKAVTLAVLVNLAEKHLGCAIPGQLSKFIHGSYE